MHEHDWRVRKPDHSSTHDAEFGVERHPEKRSCQPLRVGRLHASKIAGSFAVTPLPPGSAPGTHVRTLRRTSDITWPESINWEIAVLRKAFRRDLTVVKYNQPCHVCFVSDVVDHLDARRVSGDVAGCRQRHPCLGRV